MNKIACLLLITLLMPVLVSAANGPIDKGSVIISGTAYLSRQAGELYTDNTTMLLNPGVGIFVSKGFFLGFNLYYEHMSVDDGYWNFSASMWGLGPAVGFYFDLSHKGEFDVSGAEKSRGGATYPYIRIAAPFYRAEGANLFAPSLGVGVVMMVSNAVGVDLGVRGDYQRVSDDNPIWGDSSGDGYQLFFGAGVQAFVF